MSRRVNNQRYGILRVGPDELKEFYNRVGPWYYSVFFRSVGYRASLKYFLRHNHGRLGLKDGVKILDVGIGTGFLTINLLNEAPVPLAVVGLDFSPGMLMGLKRRLISEGMEGRVKLQIADMRQMPFADGCFDLIVTSAAMEYLPEVNDGIAECGRVLRPGGRFLFIATCNSLMGKILAAIWKNKILDSTYVMECMRSAGMHRIDILRFPWYFPHVNWWGMVLLAEKALE